MLHCHKSGAILWATKSCGEAMVQRCSKKWKYGSERSWEVQIQNVWANDWICQIRRCFLFLTSYLLIWFVCNMRQQQYQVCDWGWGAGWSGRCWLSGGCGAGTADCWYFHHPPGRNNPSHNCDTTPGKMDNIFTIPSHPCKQQKQKTKKLNKHKYKETAINDFRQSIVHIQNIMLCAH